MTCNHMILNCFYNIPWYDINIYRPFKCIQWRTPDPLDFNSSTLACKQKLICLCTCNMLVRVCNTMIMEPHQSGRVGCDGIYSSNHCRNVHDSIRRWFITFLGLLFRLHNEYVYIYIYIHTVYTLILYCIIMCDHVCVYSIQAGT